MDTIADVMIEASHKWLWICQDPPQVEFVGIHIEFYVKATCATLCCSLDSCRGLLLPLIQVQALPTLLCNQTANSEGDTCTESIFTEDKGLCKEDLSSVFQSFVCSSNDYKMNQKACYKHATINMHAKAHLSDQGCSLLICTLAFLIA